MTLDTLIRETQRALGVPADGKPGPVTWAAIHARIAPRPTVADPAVAAIDPRSEGVIASLHERVRPYARGLVTKAAAAGITIKIISGLRTFDEQAALYAKGRTKAGPKVTNAGPGYSNHNFGLAFDVGVFKGAAYVPESPLYKAVAAIGVDLGLEWGGNWKSIKDEPHYQLRPAWASAMTESAMLAELRRRKAAGVDFFTAK